MYIKVYEEILFTAISVGIFLIRTWMEFTCGLHDAGKCIYYQSNCLKIVLLLKTKRIYEGRCSWQWKFFLNIKNMNLKYVHWKKLNVSCFFDITIFKNTYIHAFLSVIYIYKYFPYLVTICKISTGIFFLQIHIQTF